MLHHGENAPAGQAGEMLLQAMRFSDAAPKIKPLIRARIAPDRKEK